MRRRCLCMAGLGVTVEDYREHALVNNPASVTVSPWNSAR